MPYPELQKVCLKLQMSKRNIAFPDGMVAYYGDI